MATERGRKIYSLPQLLGRYNWGRLYKVAFYPEYSESHLTIHDNPFGICPTPLQPDIRFQKWFDVDYYKKSDYQRRKWQRLSGSTASIYVLFKGNTPFYIGSTKHDINKRLRQHRKWGSQTLLLCACPVEFQFEEERRWIQGAKKAGFKLTNIKCYHA